MRKKKEPDNQAWLAWLSDEQPQPTDADQPPVSHRNNSPTFHRETQHKLSSASTVRLKAQPGMQHRKAPQNDLRASRMLTDTHATPSVPQESSRAIDINITLPKIRLPKLHGIHVAWGTVLRWGGLAVLVGVVVFATPQIIRLKAQKVRENTDSSQSKPAYAPLEPDTSSGTVSGAQYDSKRQLYKYNDTYKGASLTISQQTLPDALREDKSKLKDIAKASIGATEKFDTVHGDVYITTDDSTGMQRMVVAHRQLLVFIQSSKTLSNSDWVTYIQALQ